MIKWLFLTLLLFTSSIFPACSKVGALLNWTTAAGISRANLNYNPILLKTAHDDCADSLNAILSILSGYSTALTLVSNGDMRLTTDNDANGTGNLFSVTTNSTADTLLKLSDTFAHRLYGHLTIDSNLTVNKKAIITDSLRVPVISSALSLAQTLGVTGKATFTDSIVGASQRLTGNLTLGGLTASRTVETDANKILTSVAITGTGNYVKSASPTLTGTIGAASGTFSGTLGVTGAATFIAAPVFSSVTASQILSVDGSKNLTSTATTGTGSVMLAASPTTTGTLTAAAVTASGLVTATGGLALGASFTDKTTTLTGNTTLSSSHSTIFADATSAAFTITLPTAIGNAGLTYSIYKKDHGANAVTIATTSAQSIGALSGWGLLGGALESSLRVISDGANWQVLGAHETGSFTFSLTGVTVGGSFTGYWITDGLNITLVLDPTASGTSNATTFTLTTLPVGIRPTHDAIRRVVVRDNGSPIGAYADIGTNGVITFAAEVASGTPVTFSNNGFTNSGTKGLNPGGDARMVMTYSTF